jgi:hypothetical protein
MRRPVSTERPPAGVQYSRAAPAPPAFGTSRRRFPRPAEMCDFCIRSTLGSSQRSTAHGGLDAETLPPHRRGWASARQAAAPRDAAGHGRLRGGATVWPPSRALSGRCPCSPAALASRRAADVGRRAGGVRTARRVGVEQRPCSSCMRSPEHGSRLNAGRRGRDALRAKPIGLRRRGRRSPRRRAVRG